MNEKDILEIRKALIEDQIKRLEDFSYGLLRWFCTSLFVLNGGALIASIGIQEVRKSVMVDFGAYFAFGIGLSMLAAFTLGLAYSAAAKHLAQVSWNGEIFKAESIKDYLSTPNVVGIYVTSLLFMTASAGALVFGVLQISDKVKFG